MQAYVLPHPGWKLAVTISDALQVPGACGVVGDGGRFKVSYRLVSIPSRVNERRRGIKLLYRRQVGDDNLGR